MREYVVCFCKYSLIFLAESSGVHYLPFMFPLLRISSNRFLGGSDLNKLRTCGAENINEAVQNINITMESKFISILF